MLHSLSNSSNQCRCSMRLLQPPPLQQCNATITAVTVSLLFVFSYTLPLPILNIECYCIIYANLLLLLYISYLQSVSNVLKGLNRFKASGQEIALETQSAEICSNILKLCRLNLIFSCKIIESCQSINKKIVTYMYIVWIFVSHLKKRTVTTDWS